jgi:hypothetical protein
MRKGCTALDNLLSLKRLKEMNITSRSNLLIAHPGSSLADIQETRRVLHLIPHLAPLRLSHFALTRGSPLYKQLPKAERDCLRPIRLTAHHGRHLYPPELRKDAMGCLGSGLNFDLPRSLRPAPSVSRAWARFADQYERQAETQEKNPCNLTVQRLAPGSLHLFDSRYGRRNECFLKGEQAAIYEACHAGLTADEIQRQTGCSKRVVAQTVEMMTRNKLMIHVDGHFLSLALRPRDQLIAAYLAGT